MRKVIVSASVVAHGAGIVALTVMAFWRIDKLPLQDTPVRAAFVMPGTPAPAGGPKRDKLVPLKEAKPEEKPKVRVNETVQPTAEVEKTNNTGATTATTGTDEGGGGPGEGPPTGDTTTPITGDGDCTVPPCDGEKPPVVKKTIKKPVTITTEMANGLRTSGNALIHAPEQTRVTMLHEGKTQTVGTAKLCIGDDGGIDSVKLLRSTGYADYDAKLLAEMRGWRYRPYKVNGEAVPFCTAVTIVYKMRK
jgi:TonB family protein